ncbi:MAG: HAD-IA family hydrolase [Acetatifactor sp.]|nr:HAD-IA family hydrolase [Acetatifactor sp.]
MRLQKIYKKCLHLAKKNEQMFTIIDLIKPAYQLALVTTASKANTMDILMEFGVKNSFDFIITQEDVNKTKPDPECFMKVMDIAGVGIENTIIFEDSEAGLKAAELSGAKYVKVFGYN